MLYVVHFASEDHKTFSAAFYDCDAQMFSLDTIPTCWTFLRVHTSWDLYDERSEHVIFIIEFKTAGA